VNTGQWERLRTEDLVRDFGRRRVVNGVALEVGAGEIVGLLGPNGAGKTTTFYLTVGLIRPSRGRIFLGDRELTRMPMYRRARAGIGYLPQEPSVFRKLSVRDNLRAVLETRRMPRAEREEAVDRGLQRLGLDAVATQKAMTLSGGERRRLEIARSLALEPRFLLMDEPFSGVDPISVDEVQAIIAGLRDEGIGILITDHNVRETLAITDRAYLLYEGKVMAEGDREALLADPQSRRLYLGEDFRL